MLYVCVVFTFHIDNGKEIEETTHKIHENNRNALIDFEKLKCLTINSKNKTRFFNINLNRIEK